MKFRELSWKHLLKPPLVTGAIQLLLLFSDNMSNVAEEPSSPHPIIYLLATALFLPVILFGLCAPVLIPIIIIYKLIYLWRCALSSEKADVISSICGWILAEILSCVIAPYLWDSVFDW